MSAVRLESIFIRLVANRDFFSFRGFVGVEAIYLMSNFVVNFPWDSALVNDLSVTQL